MVTYLLANVNNAIMDDGMMILCYNRLCLIQKKIRFISYDIKHRIFSVGLYPNTFERTSFFLYLTPMSLLTVIVIFDVCDKKSIRRMKLVLHIYLLFDA